MKSILLLLSLLFNCFLYSCAQNIHEFAIPIDALRGVDKDNAIVDPNGKWILIKSTDRALNAQLTLYRLPDGKILDSVVDNESHRFGDIAATADGQGFYSYNKYSSNPLVVYDISKGLQKPAYAIQLPVAANTIPYTLKSAIVSLHKKTAIIVIYNLAEAGAESDLDMSSAGILGTPVLYKYKIAELRLDQSNPLNFTTFLNTTDCKLVGNADKCWLISSACFKEYQFKVSIHAVNTSTGTLTPIEAINQLGINSNLLQINAYPTSTNYWWFVNGGEMFLYNDTSKAFANLSNDKNYSTSEECTQVSGNIMLQMHKSNRKESNYISITDTSNTVQNIDTRNFIADYISIIQKDTLLALQFQKGKLQVAYFYIKQQPKPSNYVFQQPFECDIQLALSNSNFLIQSNGEGWQVFDRTTHLMVYQENYSTYTNPKFLDIEGTNYFLIIKNSELLIYEKGRWKKAKQKLLLQHPLIQEGDGVYASLLNIIGCMYNPNTKLLSVLTKKNKDWFALSFSTSNAFALTEVCKIPVNSFSNKEGGSLYSSSISVQEGLLLLALNQWKLSDWKKAAVDFNTMKASLKKFIQQTPEIYYQKTVDEIHPKGGLLFNGLLLNPYTGNAKIFDPYYKDQFPKAKLIKIEGNNAQYHFSSEGNYVVITLLESVTLYQINNEKLSIAKLPKEEYYQPTINGRSYYFLEDEAILTAYEEWRTVDKFQLLYSKPAYYSLSNARLENNQLYLIPITGNKATLLNFNTLALEPANRIPAISTTQIPRDSLWGNYYPALKKWLLVNEKIAGLDTAHLYKDYTVGRLLTTQLKEIKWAQADTVNNTVLLSNLKNSFEYWDLKTETCLYRLYVLNEKDFFIETNNGYYYATPFALPSVCTVLKGNAIPSNLINTGLNRPDKIMQVLLGDINPAYQQFAKAYLPFATKQEKVPVVSESETAPIIQLTQAPANIISNATSKISFRLQSFNTPLKSAALFINNVKVWDTTFNAIQKANIQLPITLVDGENQLHLTCKDASNQSSTPVIKRSYFQSNTTSSFKTYVITVGVSQYQDSSFNLVYAAKDAKDILAAFRKSTPIEYLVTDSLLNQQATRTGLLGLKQKLMQTKVEDKVIISFSGHGLLDSSRNFWFATYDMQFNNPAAKGFSFNEIESLLENIPARRKLILLDACNSGLADVAITDTSTSNANIVVQYNNANKKGIELGNVTRNLTGEQIQYLFSAGSNNSGAEIIAATGGNAFAFESAQYNNGIFTYALLQALQSANDADKNFNKMLSVKELKRFIYPMVEKLTRGQQRPIARFENPNYDWDVLNEIDSYKY